MIIDWLTIVSNPTIAQNVSRMKTTFKSFRKISVLGYQNFIQKDIYSVKIMKSYEDNYDDGDDDGCPFCPC